MVNHGQGILPATSGRNPYLAVVYFQSLVEFRIFIPWMPHTGGHIRLDLILPYDRSCFAGGIE